jgi:hypothetical protein
MDRIKQEDAIIGSNYLAVSGDGKEYAIIRITGKRNSISALNVEVITSIKCVTVDEGYTSTLACDVKLYDNWSESDIRAILI